jgi:hypothetical protein
MNHGDTSDVTMAGSRTAPLRRPAEVRTIPLQVLSPSAWRGRRDVQTLLPGFPKPATGPRWSPLPVFNVRTAELVRGEDLVRQMIDAASSYHARAFVVDLSSDEAESLRVNLPHEDIRGEADLDTLRDLVAEIHHGAPALYGVLTPESEGLFAEHCLIQGTAPARRPGQGRLFA